MSTFSSDEEVDNMVSQIEADYLAAQDALREGTGSAEAYREARDNFFAARQAARAGRGMGISTE